MVEHLDATGGLLEPDIEATHAEMRLAQADVAPFLSTTPIPPGQDAPVIDGKAFSTAHRREQLAAQGVRSLTRYRERQLGL